MNGIMLSQIAWVMFLVNNGLPKVGKDYNKRKAKSQIWNRIITQAHTIPDQKKGMISLGPAAKYTDDNEFVWPAWIWSYFFKQNPYAF